MDNLFGKYQLIRRLAFGGMAEIFLARLQGEGGFSKELVVKRILPQFGEDEDFVRMFIDEAVLAAHINHPNVVQIYDFGSHEGVYFIAMEFIDGVDLRQLLKRARKAERRLSSAEVAALGEQVAAGLHFAHCATDAQGTALELVHRDISPHNIMIGRGGDVKIMDFGIAKAHARATQTATGTIKGKVAYMAPEHASGEAADARSDQFSLGAVLWEALAGERLYRGESELELFRDVIGHRTRDLRGFRDDLPEELVEIVERTITREPGERFSDLAELGTALSHFRFSLGTKGAVRLGVLFSELEEHGARTVETPSQSGTLVLEDDGAVASAETASLADESGGLPATASLADQDVLRSGPATQPLEPPTPTGATLSYDQTGAHEAKAAVHSSGRSKLGLGAAGLMVAALITAVAVGMGPERATQASGAEQIEAKRSGLRVVSLPAGAKLRIDGANHEGVTPVSVEGLEAGRTLKLEVELEGYEIWRQNVTVTREVLQVDVALLERVTARGAEAAGAADAKSAEKVEIESKGGKRVSVKPRARPRVPNARKPETKAAKAAAVKPSARLDLRSAGAWYDVYLGKVRLGTTPLRGVAIPAGRHTLRLVNDGAGLSRTIDIVAEPGGRVRHTVGSD